MSDSVTTGSRDSADEGGRQGRPDGRTLRLAWVALLGVTVAWALALLHRGAGLAPDEIEFFRATRWIGEGRVPFRDFWEHHTPLQWIVFAPVTRWLADGPGADSVVMLRWAQVPLWITAFALLTRVSRVAVAGIPASLALLFSSPTFVERALEYRVDVLGNGLFLLGIAVALARPGRRAFIAFGALMSLAVLANMRMAPMTVVAALLLLWWRPDEDRWRWNPVALWMSAGVAGMAGGFVSWLALTGAWSEFAEAMFRYNRMSGASLSVRTFGDALLAPLWRLDIGGIAFWLAGIAACALALRRVKRAGRMQVLAILAVASVLSLTLMAVQYDYHLQTAWLLLVPLVADGFMHLQRRWRALGLVVVLVSLVVFVLQSAPDFGAKLRYQDAVMRAVDASTTPDERVLDGAGHALRRAPAYRYWFLTTGVRMLAARGLIEAYDLEQLRSNPPAAVIFDYRLGVYLEHFPRLAAHLTRDYVPWYRNLWLPGLSATTDAGVTTRIAWTVPRSGEYELYASELLAGHPWFTRPLEYARVTGPRALQLSISLRDLPPLPPGAVRVRAGSRAIDPTSRLVLERGTKLTIEVSWPYKSGLLLVPRGIDVLGIAPVEEFVF